jgi:hypothetical protein
VIVEALGITGWYDSPSDRQYDQDKKMEQYAGIIKSLVNNS